MILFLGYNREQTKLLSAIQTRGCEVAHSSEGIKLPDLESVDRIISYGYRHIIPPDIIERGIPIVNLHMSYLPWNRGAHPNYWAFTEGTPHGVSIHLVDKDIDTGPILYQKYVNFSRQENTFSLTYERLTSEIETLFIEHIDEILFEPLRPKPQRTTGTYHRVADLPADFPGWESDIEGYLARLDERRKQQSLDKLLIIDEIEKVRTANNVNWMDLLRLAFNSAPAGAKALIGRINSDDKRISELFSRLGE